MNSVVFRYAKRWRIENGIAEAIKFFSLNALSSPVFLKNHFDVLMTMIAHTLYHFPSQNFEGFEQCRSSIIFQKFFNMKVDKAIEDDDIIVTFPEEFIIQLSRPSKWIRYPRLLHGSGIQKCFTNLVEH